MNMIHCHFRHKSFCLLDSKISETHSGLSTTELSRQDLMRFHDFQESTKPLSNSLGSGAS